VFPNPAPRPYFENWLRRTRKQLSRSGRLTEMAMHLAKEEGNTPSYWSVFLREVLDGEIVPTLDLLTLIDLSLAKPIQNQPVGLQLELF